MRCGERNVLKLIEAGGNVYYLAKLAGIFGLNVQDIGAQQTGHVGRRVQGETRRSREPQPWLRSSAASQPPMFPRSARRSPMASRTIRTGSRSSRASTSCIAGLRDVRPDVAVVFYNDHGLNFFLDKMPTFAIGAANEYRNEDEGWGIPVSHSRSPAIPRCRGT